MQSLFNAIPRNADHESEMWTTVDPNKTNVRAKGVYKMIKGFSLYLLLMGKNFLFESKTESRYLCNRVHAGSRTHPSHDLSIVKPWLAGTAIC